jgi:hypothetical protein
MKQNYGNCVGFRCMRPLTSPNWEQLCHECRIARRDGERRTREALDRGEELRDQDDSVEGLDVHL